MAKELFNSDFYTLPEQVQINKEDIETNTASISTNTSDIVKLKDNLETNTASIATNTSDIVKINQDLSKYYLKKTDASNTYLSKNDASNTYLSKNDASNTYLSKIDASNTYLSKNDASNTYLSKNDASNTYLSKNDADNTYLSKNDADNTYVTRQDYEESIETGDIVFTAQGWTKFKAINNEGQTIELSIPADLSEDVQLTGTTDLKLQLYYNSHAVFENVYLHPNNTINNLDYIAGAKTTYYTGHAMLTLPSQDIGYFVITYQKGVNLTLHLITTI